MQTIEAYQTVDGMIFNDERRALAHEEDLLGQELDAICLLANINNMTRSDQYSFCINLMKKKPELRKIINTLYKILNSDLED